MQTWSSVITWRSLLVSIKGLLLATVWEMKGKMCWTCIIYSCDPPKQKALWGWFSHYMVKRCKSLSERNQCTFFWISDSFNKQDGSHARPWRALWRFLTRLYWWWSSLHSEEMQIQSETESDSQKAFIINKWPYRWRVAHETQKNYLLLKLKPNKKKNEDQTWLLEMQNIPRNHWFDVFKVTRCLDVLV